MKEPNKESLNYLREVVESTGDNEALISLDTMVSVAFDLNEKVKTTEHIINASYWNFKQMLAEIDDDGINYSTMEKCMETINSLEKIATDVNSEILDGEQ